MSIWIQSFKGSDERQESLAMKDFLSEQCKEIKESNKMEKTRDLFRKIRDTKGPFHAKIKDRNSKGLTEAVGSQETPGITDKVFIGRTDVEAETPIFWPTDTNS